MKINKSLFPKKTSINCHGRLIDLSSPLIMGILNVTPDSFFDGGKYNQKSGMQDRVKEIIREGANIIDIGGFSSRPGSREITTEEEKERLKPAFDYICEYYPDQLLSIDTYRSEVADYFSSRYRIDMVNDISGGIMDPQMYDFISAIGIPYIMMHMKGTPESMQKDPVYDDVVNEILYFFQDRISLLRKKGVHDIIIDPGFGFGKTLDHNYELLASLEVFSALETPILAGISRKSMISNFLELTPDTSLNATTALHMYSLLKGANILRVHDVKEASEVIKLYKKLKFTEENI